MTRNGARLCTGCRELILPDQEMETRPFFRPSGPEIFLTFHKECTKPPSRAAAPARRGP